MCYNNMFLILQGASTNSAVSACFFALSCSLLLVNLSSHLQLSPPVSLLFLVVVVGQMMIFSISSRKLTFIIIDR